MVYAYDNAIGVAEPEHGTRYYISYNENVTDTDTTTTITATAAMELTVNKTWILTDPGNMPEFVYLALQQKPEDGWESKADEKGIPMDWVTVLNPLTGNTCTLGSLKEAELLTTKDSTAAIENMPLAIGKVNAGNRWRLTYTVPKYRNGVLMQFEGRELDSAVIDRLLKYEYDLDTAAVVPSFGDFISISGKAQSDGEYHESANVINLDLQEEGTLVGTVRWQGLYWRDYVPDSVDVHVFKNGTEIDKITLKKSDHLENGRPESTWVWTLKVADYDPDAVYTVKETLSNNQLEWVSDIYGLDIYNSRSWGEKVYCEVQAVFEGDPGITELGNVKVVKDDGSSSPWSALTLEKGHSWRALTNEEIPKSRVDDISAYKLNVPSVEGYVCVLDEPYAYTRQELGSLYYHFTVHYVKQSKELKLHITKNWENKDETIVYPDSVKITVKRDGEEIAAGELTQDKETGEWSSLVVSKDKNNQNLARLDETNRKYVYTIEEDPVDGFTSRVDITEDTGDDITYTLTNTWVGPDYVNAEGEIFWEGDKDKEYLRPDTVKLSVINSKDEYVKTIVVPIKTEESEQGEKKYTWEAKYLPGKDKDGPLQYSVLESHVKGYTSTYAKPVLKLNEENDTWTWTCDVTNKLTGYFPLTIKKTLKGAPTSEEIYQFTVTSKEKGDGTEREIPLPINSDSLTISSEVEEKEVKAEFLLDEDGLYLYSVKENKGTNEDCTYDETEKLVLIVRTSSKDPKTGETEVKFESWIGNAEEDENTSSDEDGATVEGTLFKPDDGDEFESKIEGDAEKGNTVEFVNVYPNIKIKKKWDVDLLGNDCPDNIEAVVQEKQSDGSWKSVKLVELNKDNDWEAFVTIPDGDNLRVRELKEKEETILDQLISNLKGMITGYLDDEYDSVINSIKGYEGGKYYDWLPDTIKEKIDEGADSLKEELNATSENLFDKLVEEIGLAELLHSEVDRVVYDKGDGKDGDEANTVEYSVKGNAAAVLSGTDDHTTKYRVKYDKSDGTYTVTNTAIVEIDLIKRWLEFGVGKDGARAALEDKVEDKPDSAWVVLMFSVNTDTVTGNETLSGIANQAGILDDIKGLADYEIPVFRLTNGLPFYLEGGMGPASVISQLALGIDLGFLDKLIPCEMAIAKVDDDSDWRQHFVVSKYALGIPVEFKGAELGSEVIRQIVKYLTAGVINSPVSYNPFDNYFSIPMKAYPKYAGITDPKDLMDFSGLAGKVLGAVKNLLLKPETWNNINFKDVGDELKDENDQMANVINIKIDWDINVTPILTKNWEGDKEEDRPDTLKIILKDDLAEGDEEIEVILKKEDFEGKDTWTYDLSELDKKEEDGDNTDDSGDEDDDEEEAIPHSYVVVREEYPENYEHKKDYDCEIDGLELTNTWKDPEMITIRGKKVWEDDNDQDGIRPQTVTIKLLASVDGGKPEPVKVKVKEKNEETGEMEEKEVELTVETSKKGNWKFYFPEQPRYKDAEKDQGDNSGGDGENNQNGENDGNNDNSQNGGNDGNNDNSQNGENDNEERKEITYTVEEVTTDVITGVDGEGTYAFKITGDTENGFTVTNTHTTKKLTVEKKWVDRDGKETDEWIPESVKVVLQHKKGAGDTDTEPGNNSDNTGNNEGAGNGGNTGGSEDAGNGDNTEEPPGNDTDTWETVGDPVELNEANNWKAELQAKGLTESTVADWRIRELDPDGKVIFAENDKDKPEDAKNEVVFSVKKDDKNNDVPYVVSYEVKEVSGEDTGSESNDETGGTSNAAGDEGGKKTVTVITNKRNGKQVTVEKSWDIDLEKNDKPESIEAVIQEKKDDKWETVALVELNGDNSWKESRILPVERDGKEIEYRARELREETALETIVKNLKETISSAVTGNYDEIIGQIKSAAGDYYTMLPDSIKNAADQGSDKLKDELKTTTENLYDKLIEKIGIASSENRIVYDKDDSDKPKDNDKKDDGKKDEDGGNKDDKKEENKSETNAVIYSVGEHTSAISGGTVNAHKTKYRVKYGKDGDTYKITNKAILEVDVIKRWLTFGVEDEDKPDAAWVVLMFKLAANKDSEAVTGAASAAGVDLSSLVDYEFPVFNLGALGEETPFLLEEGQDPLSIISQLTIGIDLDIFSGVLPKMAIARVTKDDNWRVHYVVSKYAMGLPVEFKGAELGSEIIRQIIKYVTSLDIPVSYNPFDNYISIPTKAIRTILGMEDLDDLSKLPQAALDKIKGMTMDDWKNLSPETALTDELLMANVINIKIDWDTDKDNTIHGTKTWKDDKEENRPDTLLIHIKDGKEEIEGSPITLNKSDFEGKNEWTWELDLDGDKEGEGDGGDGKDNEKEEKKIDPANLTVTEEYPEGYEYADKYTCEIDDLDITNTWHDKEPETINISGKKIWEDDKDKDGIRPEKITVKLLADGEEVKSVETSKEGGWKYHFTDLPKYKDAADDEKEIVYTIEEVEVEGYESEVDGYNLINTHEPETITIEGTKVWEDAEDQDGKRPDSITIRLKADGKEVDSVKVTEGEEDGRWTFQFEDQPKANGGKDIVYTITEDTVEDYTTEIEGDAEKGFTVTNTYEPDKTQVNVTKVWNDKDDQDGIRPDSVTVKLLADGKEAEDENGEVLTLELSEDEDWTGTFEDLDEKKNGKDIVYTVEEETDDVVTGEDGEGTYSFKVSGDAREGFTVTNRHTPETVTIEGKKIWEDEDNKEDKRPDRIVIRVKANGKEVKNQTVTAGGGWTWKFDGLPKYEDGEEIEYTISEDKVKGYTTEVDEFDVTNTYNPNKTQVDVTKVWEDDDDRDGIRPNSVTITLLADGEPAEGVDPLILSEGNSWTGSFKDLPMYVETEDEDDETEKTEIVYTIREETDDVITGKDSEGTYRFTITGDITKGFTVTNTHTPETVTIKGKKVWDDANDRDKKRPDSITVRLLADNEEVASKVIKKADNWPAWSFEDLPKKAGGKDIVYTVTEDTVADYTTAVEGDTEKGFTVTNTYTPGKTQVTVSKVWDDEDDADGIRPASVTASLLADGKEIGKTLVLSEGSNWSGTFTDLDAKKDGEEIAYTVTEKQTEVITGTDGPGTYGIEIKGDAEKGFTISNKHKPERRTINVIKVWDDADNQGGKRPESIRIRLKADGKDRVVKEITADNEWKWSFEKLPKYDGAKEIVYTLTEDAVTDYTTKVEGSAEEGFTVTNKYNPGKTQITVAKVWSDEDDQDVIRPEDVRVFLLADGEKTGKETRLNDKNNWTYTFENLDVRKDGNPVKYTVEEEKTRVITGTDGDGTYAVNVKGSAAKGFTVTNIHTPRKIQIEVQKVWDDKDDQDKIRPKSIQLQLWDVSGDKPEEVEHKVIKASEGWETWVIDGMSRESEYVVEEKLAGVITGTDGPGTYAYTVSKHTDDDGFNFTVTNTHTPETVTVKGTKIWEDKELPV